MIMNTKKLFLLVLSLMETVALCAGVVPVSDAMQVAKDFINSHNGMNPGGHQRSALSRLVLEQASYRDHSDFYIFNNTTEEGFVIVSADDRTQPILGYSDSGTFDETQVPDNMRLWLEDYAEQIRQLDYLGISHRLSAVSRRVSRHPVSPLIPCRWSQHAPYNGLCPVDPGTKDTCLTGCGATAMAQAMYYFKYPSRTTTTIPAYTTKTRNISMPAISPTAIDWENIMPIYNDDFATTVQKQAVASLLKICGSALSMDYGSEASSTSISEVAYALRSYFGYDAGLQATNHATIGLNEWDDAVYGELAAGRPVIYRGTRDREGGHSGHIFVIDGYDENGYYHLNWGWDGRWNGYFMLNVLSPYVSAEDEMLLSNEGYCLGHWAIFGMQPDTGGTPPPLVMTAQALELTNGDATLHRNSTSVNFPEVALTCKTYNKTGDINYFDVGVGLIDAAGQLVETALTITKDLDPNYGWKSLKAKIAFGKGLADGTYRLVNISRESGKDLPWQISKDGAYYCVYATVNGKALTLRGPNLKLTGDIYSDTQLEAGKMNALKTSIHNEGNDFSGEVFLYIDGSRFGGRFIEIASGSTANLDMGFTPAKTGMYNLKLAYYNKFKADTVFFANKNVSVNSAAYNNLKLTLTSTNAKDQIIGSTYQMEVMAYNQSSAIYDNNLRAYIYKLRPDGSGKGDFVAQQDRHLTLAGRQSKNVTFEFHGLDDGDTYFVWIYYFSNGDIVSDKDKRLYGGRVTVNVATGLSGIHADDEMTDIHNAAGMLVTRCRRTQVTEILSSLPKGLYIIDGKKTVNR